MEPTNLLEAATLHYSIKVSCRCGHSAVFNPHGLWWHFRRHSWSDRLGSLTQRFWCRVCRSQKRAKVRPSRTELVRYTVGEVELPLPPTDVWKRQMRRIR